MIERNLNALLVLILSGVLLAGFCVQIFVHEQPCPLCLLQRLGMLGVACGALLNIKFGVRHSHYALSLLACAFGGFVALRQILLHICPGTPPFGSPVLGLSLYTWSFIVFFSSLLYIALLMLIFEGKERPHVKKLNPFCFLAFILLFGIAFANIISTLILCGLGACVG